VPDQTDLNKAMSLVKPGPGQEDIEDDIDIGEPEDYEDTDNPDFDDEDDITDEDLEPTEGESDDEEEAPEDLRSAFIRAQAELQRVRAERDKATPKPKSAEDWVAAHPELGELGEDGKATPQQREAYYNSRVLAAEMKVARMEAEREAGVAVTFLDLLSDAGVELEFTDAGRFSEAMIDVNTRITEILDALLEAEVAEKMKEVEKRWGVNSLRSSPKEPRRGQYQDKKVSEAAARLSDDRSPENVARFIRARARARQP